MRISAAALRSCRLRASFQLPRRQQFTRGLSSVIERKERIRGNRLFRFRDRQITQPKDRSVLQGHAGIRPVRLIAGNAVARVSYFKREFHRVGQGNGYRHPRRPAFDDAGIPQFRVPRLYHENHAAAAGTSVNPRHRFEPLHRF